MFNISVSVSRCSFVMRAGDYYFSAVAGRDAAGVSFVVATDSDGCMYEFSAPCPGGSAMRHAWHIGRYICRNRSQWER